MASFFKKLKKSFKKLDRNQVNELFDGQENSHLFLHHLPNAKVYAEYGCGLSTQHVLNNTNLKVLSVDTSLEWVNKVKGCRNGSRLNIHYVDVGKVGNWGRPIGYSKRDNFREYTDWVWKQSDKPDFVLIDGRFRVACFLTSLINADEGTKIIFDDYSNRHYYHIVEEFLTPTEIVGRQGLFITKKLDTTEEKKIVDLLNTFRNVMD